MTNELINNIDKLIKLTKEDKIRWQKTSSTAYIWFTTDAKENKVNVIIQNTDIFPDDKVEELLFRIWDPSTKSAKFDITTSQTSEETKKYLFTLFKLAQEKHQMGDLDYLSELINKVE